MLEEQVWRETETNGKGRMEIKTKAQHRKLGSHRKGVGVFSLERITGAFKTQE